jgi:hypothetical protein
LTTGWASVGASSETAEASIAYAASGDLSTATDLLAWTRSHRLDDGSYWTGIVYPSLERFPFGETSAYTAAAVILAADAITVVLDWHTAKDG